jgi:hypothetical protein
LPRPYAKKSFATEKLRSAGTVREDVLAVGSSADPHVALPVHDPLGLAGRSARIEKEGEVVAVGGRVRERLAFGDPLRRLVGVPSEIRPVGREIPRDLPVEEE